MLAIVAYCTLLKVMQKMMCCECNSRSLIQNTLFSSHFMNGPNKLECYTTLGWKCLPGPNTVAYCTLLKVTQKMMCCEYDSRSLIHNTLFSSQLMNGPNKLECYTTLGWKCLPGPNTLAYWDHYKLWKKRTVMNITASGLSCKYWATFESVLFWQTP